MRRLPGSGTAGSGQCGCLQSNVLRCELAAHLKLASTPHLPVPSFQDQHSYTDTLFLQRHTRPQPDPYARVAFIVNAQ